MENIAKLFQDLQELMISLHRAKNFVDEGKEVLCSRQLQGSLVKCNNILIGIKNEFLVNENNSKKQTEPE